MESAFSRALALLFAGDPLLTSILRVTMTMTLISSCTALLFGAPYGVLLASARFPGRRALIILNRTLMGLPPVVCGLLCYLLFSGVGPLRALKLLFTVAGMVVAQVLLITPIVAGSMETSLSPLVEGIRESAQGLDYPVGKRFCSHSMRANMRCSPPTYLALAARWRKSARCLWSVGRLHTRQT